MIIFKADRLKTKKQFYNKHFLELFPLLLSIFILLLAQGGESEFAKFVFFSFPFFYLPILFRKKRKVGRKFRVVFYTWLLFLITAFFSTIFSASFSLSLPAFFELMGMFLYFTIFYVVIENEKDLERISTLIMAATFILSLLSFWYIAFPPTSFPVMNLVYAKYGHNHLSDLLIFAIPVSIGLFLKQKRANRVLASALLVLFFFASFYLTFARTAFAIVTLVTLLLVLRLKPSLNRRIFILSLGLLPLGLVVIFMLVTQLHYPGRASASIHSSSWFLRQVIKPLQHEGRFEYWQQAVSGIKLRPLLGNGPGTFRLTSRRFQRQPTVTSWFAHNLILEFASELGILGLSAFLLLLYSAFSAISLSKKQSNYHVFLLAGATGSLLQSLLDFNFNFLAIFVLFWIVLASLLKLSSISSEPLGKSKAVFISLISVICLLFTISMLLSDVFLKKAKVEAINSESDRAKSLYNWAFSLPSLNSNRIHDFLQQSVYKQGLGGSGELESLLVFWNREDPQVYIMLAQIQKSPKQSLRLYKQAVGFSSTFEKMAILQQILRFEDTDNEYLIDLFFDILSHHTRLKMDEKYNNLTRKQISEIAKYIKQFQDPLATELHHYRWWASKSFYFMGLDYLEKDANLSLMFWDWARLISPDFDYFQIEAASLNYHIFNDSYSAREILTQCLANKFSAQSCENQLKHPPKFLPTPSSYKSMIENIIYR